MRGLCNLSFKFTTLDSNLGLGSVLPLRGSVVCRSIPVMVMTLWELVVEVLVSPPVDKDPEATRGFDDVMAVSWRVMLACGAAGGSGWGVVDDPIPVLEVLALTLSVMAATRASLLVSPWTMAWIASGPMTSC